MSRDIRQEERVPSGGGWKLPLSLVAMVWLLVVLVYQVGLLTRIAKPYDEAWSSSDPDGLALSTRIARELFRAGACDAGLAVWRRLDAREPYAPEWTEGEAIVCFESRGRVEVARTLLASKCAGAVVGEERVVAAYRAAPRYPERARSSGTEGYVVVAFDIDLDGHVQAPTILDSDPAGTFDATALDAVRRWRYCPGAELSDQRVRFDFEMAPVGLEWRTWHTLARRAGVTVQPAARTRNTGI